MDLNEDKPVNVSNDRGIICERLSDSMCTCIFQRLAFQPNTLELDEIINRNNRMCETLSRTFAALVSETSVDGSEGANKTKFTTTFDVVNGDYAEPFFGVRIFPSIATLEAICRAMIVNGAKIGDLHKLWHNCNEWHVELDYSMFMRSEVGATPEDIVSLIIRAWSNTYHEYTSLDRFVEACKEWFYVKPISKNPNPNPFYEGVHRMSVEKKSKIKMLHLLFTVPLWVSCKFADVLKEVPNKYMDISVGSMYSNGGLYGEWIYKYRDTYYTAVSKLVKRFGSEYDKGEQYSIDKVEYYVRWALQNAVDENRRYHQMKDELLSFAQMSSGQYGAALSIKLLNDFGISLRENYTGAILESAQVYDILLYGAEPGKEYTPVMLNSSRNVLDSAVEGITRGSRNKAPVIELYLPSDYDIDTIGIEVDRITCHRDRVYVLDLIYTKVEEIEACLRYWEDDSRKHSSKAARVRSKAKSQLAILGDYRNMVMKKRSFNKDYKVFVRVPEGYEG